ncbi:MAG: tetratricopeptide repeat protein [Myxococcota bacterium]|nr:tetratricopeptide repeat protein [Myxococcota bacterium]
MSSLSESRRPGPAFFGGLALVVLFLLVPPLASAQDGEQGPPEEGPRKVLVIEDSPFEVLEVLCTQDRKGAACYEAARAWHEGRGIPKPNPLQALNLYTAGCSFGFAPACMAGAKMITLAQGGFVILQPKGTLSLDFGEAARLARIACDLKELAGCGLYGDLMIDPQGLLPNKSTVVGNIKHDALAARQAFFDGCHPADQIDPLKPRPVDVRSCLRLAQMYEEGSGGLIKNWDRAIEHYQRACTASGGEGDWCDRAIIMEFEGPGKEAERPRTSVQPQRPTPDVDRFENNPDTRLTGQTKGDHSRRVEIVLGTGIRWLYGPGSFAGLKLNVGVNLWFNVLGFSLDTNLTTDKFVNIAERTYLRFQHGFGPMLGIPIPDKLPFPIAIRLVFGGGGTLAHLKRGPDATFVLGYGARQRIQLEAGNERDSGPRQWGALRIEQQQTWYTDIPGQVEHATEVTLVGGFTFGGWGPDWRAGRR